MQMQLDEQNRLLTERGMVLVGNDDGEDDDVASDDGKGAAGDQDQRTRAIVSAETAAILSGLGKGPLDVRFGPLTLYFYNAESGLKKYQSLIKITMRLD